MAVTVSEDKHGLKEHRVGGPNRGSPTVGREDRCRNRQQDREQQRTDEDCEVNTRHRFSQAGTLSPEREKLMIGILIVSTTTVPRN